ncbi:MAG: HAMP domain-containing sensor histidine kinase [Hyphomonadaceae bacterium]
MSMLRSGLFQKLFARFLMLVAATLFCLVAFVHLYQGRHLRGAWRAGVQEEAMWVAQTSTIDAAPDSPANAAFASRWREAHASTRLIVRDSSNAVLIDTQPSRTPRARATAATARSADGRLTFELTRNVPPPFPMEATGAMSAAALALIALAAALLYPWTQSLARTFSALGQSTRLVAAGKFGAPLSVEGGPELEELIRSFNTMADRLRAEDLHRKALIANVSHELRSPMGRIRALTETIARHPNEAQALTAKMESEIALLDRLVGDMLEVARHDAGVLQLSTARRSVASWAAETVESLRLRTEQAGVALASQINISPAALADIDSQRLLQSVANIVENAIVATAGAANARIDVTIGEAAGGWRIVVADNGKGIPAEKLPLVFERFYRVEPDRSRATGGIGLGLSITKSIVEAHGGAISIESAVGQGSTVAITLPLAAERA